MPTDFKLVAKRGFTVIEILVSAAIISVLASVVLLNYRMSEDNLSVSAEAQNLSIAIRQAQAYGLSVKESGIGSGIFTYAYGIYFNPTLNPTSYYIFSDNNNDKIYDSGDTVVEVDNLRNSVKVTAICDSSSCPPGNAQAMSITFIRPNPNARIYFANSSGAIVSGPSTEGKIVIKSPAGKLSTTTVESTGEVLVQ